MLVFNSLQNLVLPADPAITFFFSIFEAENARRYAGAGGACMGENASGSHCIIENPPELT